MKKQTVITIIVIIILIILSIGWCTEHRNHLTYKAQIHQHWVNDTLRLTKQLQADSSSLYQMQQQLGTEANARAIAQNDARNYKNLLAVVKAKVGAQKTNVEVRYIDRPTTLHYTDTLLQIDTACIPVGTAFAYADKWFYTAGSLGTQNIKIDSIGFYPGTVKVIIGNKKGNLFKRSQPAISLVFENPNMYAHSATNIIVADKRKPRRGLWLISGIAVGLVGGLLAK